jgi:hypothetical protein
VKIAICKWDWSLFLNSLWFTFLSLHDFHIEFHLHLLEMCSFSVNKFFLKIWILIQTLDALRAATPYPPKLSSYNFFTRFFPPTPPPEKLWTRKRWWFSSLHVVGQRLSARGRRLRRRQRTKEKFWDLPSFCFGFQPWVLKVRESGCGLWRLRGAPSLRGSGSGLQRNNKRGWSKGSWLVGRTLLIWGGFGKPLLKGKGYERILN